MHSEIVAALCEQNLIELVYLDQWYVIQPYCYGISLANQECIFGYITETHDPGSLNRWKLFEIEKADAFNILKETFTPLGQPDTKELGLLKKIYLRL